MTRLIHYPALRELILSRLREFFREPEVIFWVYGFPLLLAVGLGIAFRTTPLPEFRVGVVDGERASPALAALQNETGFRATVHSEDEGRAMLARGKLDVLVIPGATENRYILDPARGEARLARERLDHVLQHAAGRRDPLAVKEEVLSEPGSRYIDFLMPGLMGMNLLGGGIWGVGFFIVDMRVRKLLKRFMATPMRHSDFFISILASRIIFMVPEMLFLFGAATIGFGVPFRGDPLSLITVILCTAFCFAGIGLLIATRARKLETISGLINLVALPMWLLSGIFFNTDRFPDIMQPVIQALPLTAANNALRAVILDGQAAWTQSTELGILLAWTVLCFALSLKLFRWT